MKISLGTDHAGFRYKEKVKELLGTLGHEVKDCGTFSEEPVDYPLFIRPAAEAVARGECERGIGFGGSSLTDEARALVAGFARSPRRQGRCPGQRTGFGGNAFNTPKGEGRRAAKKVG